ncbi:restriction endonuclease subunit S [Enterococcus faecalis]|uniref:restriction endonuclease subunit S n=1 Tax=Enterococcus faecalis TaxID=1351 RepID=UPI0020322546|nr:restriction endonuclease subunit S [Enterococcus faecalis]
MAKIDDSVKKKVPELRFSGFTDDWEERKLGEVATFLNGRAYKQDELLDSGKYKVLRVGNFYTNDSWYYSNMELGDKYYVDKGDLVYTWSATFGPHIWSGEKVIYHYHIWKVELSKFLDRNFTLQLLKADKARLLSSTNGSTMIHVTKGDMESKIVSIPNIDEQKQIGSFFKQLDETIALHQRKLDLLKEQKKGYLQKMFPKNGAKVPELRFAGFADDWKERKLGDYVIIRSGWSPSNFDINNNANNLFIKVDDLNYSTRVQEESQVKVNILSKYKKMKKSSTIFPKRGAAIMTNKVRMLGEDSYMDTNMMALEPKGIDPEYLYTFINKTGLYKIADTSTIPQINNKHIEPYLLLIPSLEEQHKIGSFFKQLDGTIALHQRKLDLLKEQKKGFLQKMFV